VDSRIREAFDWIEEWFRQNNEGGGKHHCPWCYHSHDDGIHADGADWKDIEHDPNCLIGEALSLLTAEPEPCEDAREVACSIDEVWKVLGDDTGETARICLDNAAQRIESYASRLAHEARSDERRRWADRAIDYLRKHRFDEDEGVGLCAAILKGTEPATKAYNDRPFHADPIFKDGHIVGWGADLGQLREAISSTEPAKRSLSEVFAELRAEYGANFDRAFPEPTKVSEDVERDAQYLRRFIQDHAFPTAVAYDLIACVDRLVARLKEDR
jgi:hypothetical protein